MVVPTDGGTSDGAMADFQPLFDAVARDTGVTFKLSVGTSYISVVEAMAAGKVDVAFFGPVSFLLAKERGAALDIPPPFNGLGASLVQSITLSGRGAPDATPKEK